MEPRFGLANELLSRSVITTRQHSAILAEQDVYCRCDYLLQCLSSSDLSEAQYGDLLVALDSTAQAHVANFIRQNGGSKYKTISTSPN